MSGKFISVKRQDTIENIIEGFKKRIDNPYYLHTDKKPTIVDYYHINNESSTVDEGLQIHHTQIGSTSPFKYDLIKDFYLYGGFNQINIQLENSEFGLRSDNIVNISYVLPNTIRPIPGDYFKISYLDKSYLFKVISVDIDTLESGANFYKIEHEYSVKDDLEMVPLIKDTYRFIIKNVGTEFKPILKKEEYDYIGILQELTNQLKEYYTYLYYSHRVQSFISSAGSCGARFYDPYLTEFLIRNNILQGSSTNYIYITQQMGLPTTFGIDYDNSFFRSLELKSINRLSKNTYVSTESINQPLSLLCMRLEEYNILKHVSKRYKGDGGKFEVFTKSLIRRIKDRDVRDENIIVEAFNIFKGSIFIEENLNVVKFVDDFKGVLNIIQREDQSLYNGIVNILETDLEAEEIEIFKGIVNITDVPIEVTNIFNGILEISNEVKIQLYDGILNILKEADAKEQIVLFKGMVFLNNSVAHNRNKIDNLIIKYFNNMDISITDIKNLEDVQYTPDSILFYYIPIVIFILEKYIINKLIK